MCTRKIFLYFFLCCDWAPVLRTNLCSQSSSGSCCHALTLSSCTCSSSLVTGNRHSSPTLCSHISLPVIYPYLSLMWKIQVAFSAMMLSLTPLSSNYSPFPKYPLYTSTIALLIFIYDTWLSPKHSDREPGWPISLPWNVSFACCLPLGFQSTSTSENGWPAWLH